MTVDEYIDRLVKSAPPLTAEQLERLRVIFGNASLSSSRSERPK